MESPVFYKAIRNYDGRGGGKAKTLSFPSGAVIKVTVIGKRGWCRGEYNSKQGWFPSQFIADLKDEVCSLPMFPEMQNLMRKDDVQSQCYASKSLYDNQDRQQYGETMENNKVVNIETSQASSKRSPVRRAVNYYAYIEAISNSEEEADAPPQETRHNMNNKQKTTNKEKTQAIKIDKGNIFEEISNSKEEADAPPEETSQNVNNKQKTTNKEKLQTIKIDKGKEISNSKEADAPPEETSQNVNSKQKRTNKEKLQAIKILCKGLAEASTPTNNTLEDHSITKFTDANALDLAEKTPVESNQSHENLVEMINGLSFPLMGTTQKLLRTNTTSYCDHFWRDLEESSGFYLVYEKIIREKEMCREMVKLFKARETLENQYAKGLASISTSLHAAEMKGTLGNAWKQFKATTKLEAQSHKKFASMLRLEVRQPLEELRDHKRKEMKKINSIIGDLRIMIYDKFKRLEMTGHHFLELEKETQIKVENNASEEQVLKSQAYQNAISDELPALMIDYNKTRQHWCSEVADSCNFLEKEEINRINKISLLLSHYCKLKKLNTNQVSVSADILLQALSKVSPDEDREEWIKKNATGTIRPVDLTL